MNKCVSCQLFQQECSGSERNQKECQGIMYQPKPEAKDTLEEKIINILLFEFKGVILEEAYPHEIRRMTKITKQILEAIQSAGYVKMEKKGDSLPAFGD